jgi:hypothetical protein
MTIPPKERKSFEEMGEAQVRLQFGAIGFSYPRQNYARIWLAEIDEDRAARNEVLRAEQTRLNKNTLKTAWIAVYVAISALAFSIIAILISVLR